MKGSMKNGTLARAKRYSLPGHLRSLAALCKYHSSFRWIGVLISFIKDEIKSPLTTPLSSFDMGRQLTTSHGCHVTYDSEDVSMTK